jgi:hypothetical protein
MKHIAKHSKPPLTGRYEKNWHLQNAVPTNYVGQTGWIFYTRYKEVRTHDDHKGRSSHILCTGHTSGSITDTGNIMKTEKRENPKYIRKIAQDNKTLQELNTR